MKCLLRVSTVGRWSTTFALLLTLALAPVNAADAPRPADLGEGLRYYRVHEIPAELPTSAPKAGPSVVDLRNGRLAPGSAAVLEGWLRFHAAPTAPVFILVNGRTAPELAAILAANRRLPGVLVVGLPAPGLDPDIVVAAPAADDERAYDAFEHGTSLHELLTENADKPRSDEAAIMRDRSNPPRESEDDDAADEGDRPAAPAEPPKPAPLIDTTLQKAVQLHRAMRALRRL